MLITDVAPCNPSLSHKFGWHHEACNHSKGVFCIKKRIRKNIFWFTQVGSMRCGDCQSRPYHVVFRPEPTAMWTQNWCEASGCGNGVGWTPKPKAFWRSLVAPWRSARRCEREKHRPPFQEQIPCKLQDIIKKALQIPGEFEAYFGEWISSFAMVKTTFFSKRSKCWRGFPPDGKFLQFNGEKTLGIQWHLQISLRWPLCQLHSLPHLTRFQPCRNWPYKATIIQNNTIIHRTFHNRTSV